jgi:hypothetical protein
MSLFHQQRYEEAGGTLERLLALQTDVADDFVTLIASLEHWAQERHWYIDDRLRKRLSADSKSDTTGYRDYYPVGLSDVSTYPDLLAELMRRGWSDADIAKLAGGNILRVLRQGREGTAAVRALVDCSELQAELIARKLQQLTSIREVVVQYASSVK